MRYRTIYVVLPAIALLGSPIRAQDLSSSEIKANIRNQIDAFSHPRTRSLHITNHQDANECQFPPCEASTDEAPAQTPATARPIKPLKVTIQFAYNSATIERAAQHTIVSIAAALGDPEAAGHVFEVKGYTDARGSTAYNLRLSTRRAASVVASLRQLGVPAERMRAVGKGKSDPLRGVDPKDERNRRVEVLIVE